MQEKGSSENHQVNNLKVVINFANFLGPNITFYNICKKEQITSFLNTKIKSSDIDPDKKWITTWNHFLNRIKLFMRWLYNYHYRLKQNNIENNYSEDINDNNNEWITPEFCKIKPKQIKRISPYLESEIWEKDELLTIINGYNVLGFLDPIQALVHIQANPNQHCLLISDFRMNKLNGCELGIKVQELNNNIKVIIISACENIEGNFRNFELLNKPISIPNLIAIAKVRSYVK
jgi:CheY-like chemotaxis protein